MPPPPGEERSCPLLNLNNLLNRSLNLSLHRIQRNRRRPMVICCTRRRRIRRRRRTTISQARRHRMRKQFRQFISARRSPNIQDPHHRIRLPRKRSMIHDPSTLQCPRGVIQIPQRHPMYLNLECAHLPLQHPPSLAPELARRPWHHQHRPNTRTPTPAYGSVPRPNMRGPAPATPAVPRSTLGKRSKPAQQPNLVVIPNKRPKTRSRASAPSSSRLFPGTLKRNAIPSVQRKRHRARIGTDKFYNGKYDEL